MPSIQPYQFGIAAEIFDKIGSCFIPLLVEDPALVGVVETSPGAMGIIWCVGVAMVEAMGAGPPQRTFLYGRRTQEREDELKYASGFVASVGKIAMVPAGDRKHAKEEKAGAEDDGGCCHTGEKNQET